MRRPGPDEWNRLIAEYESSGLSHKDFIAKHDIAMGTFQFWLYRVRKSRKIRTSESESDSRPRFLPIEVVASPAVTRAGGDVEFIELGLRSGTTVRFSVGTNVRYLAELFAALG